MALEEILGNLTGGSSPKDQKRIGGDTLINPIDLENGVVFFDCVGEQFGKSLSAFIKKQKVTVLAMTANTNHNGVFRGGEMTGKLNTVCVSIIGIIVFFILASGCASPARQPDAYGHPIVTSTPDLNVTPNDLGHGLLLFSCDDTVFTPSLVNYLDTHQNLSVVGIHAIPNRVSYNSNEAFIVVVK